LTSNAKEAFAQLLGRHGEKDGVVVDAHIEAKDAVDLDGGCRSG
jgi:hypothetical protein